MSKVSIIIPYLKGQAYLEECLETISRQTISDYEVIIVNDRDGEPVPDSVAAMDKVTVYNATEELPEEVVREYEQLSQENKENKIRALVDNRLSKAERFRDRVENGEQGLAIFTEEQLNPDEEALLAEYDDKIDATYPYGVAHCRNIGIQKASGKYIYFMDSDDYFLEDNALELLVNLAEQKNAKITTGNKYSSWFRPVNFDMERAKKETEIEGVFPLTGEILKERFNELFSAQHLLIARDMIVDNDIEFDTTNTYFSDASFVVNVLVKAGEDAWFDGGSVYVWRHHNDSIHAPALCQKPRQKKGREKLEAYQKSIELLGGKDEAIRETLEYQLVRYCNAKFPSWIKGEVAEGYTAEFNKMRYWKPIMKKFGFLRRTEMKLVKKGKYRMTKPVIRFARWKSKKKGIFGSRLQWYRFFEKHIFRKMPIRKDWVLFESFFGRSYSDSPKYLYEYLQKTRGDKYRYVWSLDKKSEALDKSGKHKQVKRNSLRYVYYASRCGYRIFNVRQPAWMKKRAGVIFLETWHGTPLKKLVFDLDDILSASQNHKVLFYEQDRDWNYLVSANRYSTDIFERAFAYNREKILEDGYPRNDILYADNKDEIAREVKQELGIPEGKRVILYAPTWRDNQFYSKGHYKFQLAMDLDLMRRELSQDTVILLRTHYHISDILDLSEYAGFVYNGSQYEDVSRLYLASDICITDYSSVFFDFANLRRPMLFFVYDLDEYADEIRGLYFDMETTLPGPLLHTNDELLAALKNMDPIVEKYKDRYDAFYEKFCSVDDGHASERIIEKVFGEREKLFEQ